VAGKLRSWFLRNVLESIEREFGSGSVELVASRVPPRLRAHLSLERLRASAPLDTMPLDEGEEVLLALEGTLGDGSGRVLERVAEDLISKSLVQGGGAVRVGDLAGTVARLRSYLEHPFEDVRITFELERSEGGLALGLGVAGQPRATKVLRHLAAGAIRAAERFARESVADSLRITSELFADRARVVVQLRRAGDPVRDDAPAPPTRRMSGSLRQVTATSLSAEVDRILNPSLEQAERRRSNSAPPPPLPGAPSTLPPPPKDVAPSLAPLRKGSSPNLPALTGKAEDSTKR
jgi:hypothetical protein